MFWPASDPFQRCPPLFTMSSMSSQMRSHYRYIVSASVYHYISGTGLEKSVFEFRSECALHTNASVGAVLRRQSDRKALDANGYWFFIARYVGLEKAWNLLLESASI